MFFAFERISVTWRDEMLTKMKDIMTRTSFHFFEDEPIEYASKIFTGKELEAVLVFNQENQLTGVVTERELLQGMLLKKQKVCDIMLPLAHFFQEEMLLGDIELTEATIYPVLNKNDKVIGFVSKKKILEHLSEEYMEEAIFLQAIFNSAHNGILSINKQGEITSINPAAEQFAKTSSEQAVGKFLTDIVAPSGLLEVLRTGEKESEKYQVGKRKFITNRSPIKKNGEVIGAVGVFQDISEIEFISKELETVKNILDELDSVIDSSHDGILITDARGEMVKANKALNKIFGMEQVPNHFLDFQQHNIHLSVIEKVIKTGKKMTVIAENDVRSNVLLITATPVHNTEGKLQRVVVNIRDMTEIDKLRKELAEAKRSLSNLKYQNNSPFIAQSPAMQSILKKVNQIAKVDSIVLITGESGVGKEEIANQIHYLSNRKDYPFIKVNCGAIPETLLESELFGYEPGAFTGAQKKGKVGLFEAAHKGTLFLDEIAEMPLQLQVKLLRVLQEQEIVRIGGIKPKKIDVRILVASNKDLQQLVDSGEFRLDLFYRINVVPIVIPPLRERQEDIPLLIAKFKKEIVERYGKNVKFPTSVMEALVRYHWPGNVRELSNIVERLIVTTEEEEIQKDEVNRLLYHGKELLKADKQVIQINSVVPLKEAIDEVEKQLLMKCLKMYKSTRGMADALKVNQSTIVRKMKKFRDNGE